MRPASGLSRPSASFRIVLLPDPAMPKIALVSPWASRKEMPFSTSLSSNCRTTSSNATASPAGSLLPAIVVPEGKVGVAMLQQPINWSPKTPEANSPLTLHEYRLRRASRPKDYHKQPGHKDVNRDNKDHSGNHGLGGCASNALGTTFRR